MAYKVYLEQVQSKHPYTYEETCDNNNNSYLHEERCEDTIDYFGDNDF
ncbi:hypothetical protein P9B03_13015 [Metasolibacillus meyeri]|uniref:Phage protein n=1 Tax=Metasolibacillus meyeri TaxID=1071052 RepID=A0AAW9NWJ7_9BACL|nr:hypothetical protein [Metasolibacillus meyeri]MEC1179411.1 hypothetical protein [Metasolibacillus meyeri]